MEVFISLFMKYLGYKPMEKLTLLDARTFILDKRRCGISASTCNFYNSSIAFLYKYVLHIPWDQNLVPRMKRDTRLPQLLSMKLCRKLLNCRQYISVAYLFFIIYSNSTVGQLQIKILVHYIHWISFHPVFYIVKINDRTFY